VLWGEREGERERERERQRERDMYSFTSAEKFNYLRLTVRNYFIFRNKNSYLYIIAKKILILKG